MRVGSFTQFFDAAAGSDSLKTFNCSSLASTTDVFQCSVCVDLSDKPSSLRLTTANIFRNILPRPVLVAIETVPASVESAEAKHLLIPAGGELPITRLSVLPSTLKVFLEHPCSGDPSDPKNWSTPCALFPFPKEDDHLQLTWREDDGKANALNLLLDVSYTGSARVFTLYCPFVTLDETGLGLAYHAGHKAGKSEETTGLLQLPRGADVDQPACCLFSPTWDYTGLTVFAKLDGLLWFCQPFNIGTMDSVGSIKLYPKLNLTQEPIQVDFSYAWQHKEGHKRLGQIYTFRPVLKFKNAADTPVHITSCAGDASAFARTVGVGEEVSVNAPLPDSLLWKVRTEATGEWIPLSRGRCGWRTWAAMTAPLCLLLVSFSHATTNPSGRLPICTLSPFLSHRLVSSVLGTCAQRDNACIARAEAHQHCGWVHGKPGRRVCHQGPLPRRHGPSGGRQPPALHP